MNVVFVAPNFPSYQHHFVRALKQVGATIIGIDETPYQWLNPTVQRYLDDYEQVPSVTDTQALHDATRRIQQRCWVDRMEATIEAHLLPTAHVREACTIPGMSVATTLLCRDKTKMKDFVREQGIACAASTRATSAEAVRTFAQKQGYPLILKPVAAAGAADTYKIENPQALEPLLQQLETSQGFPTIAVEAFVSGHEGFYDTLVVGGRVRHDFISHYYPNVLEAMRTRWISPAIITTNRCYHPSYNPLKLMGNKVIAALGIDTAPTHMEWFVHNDDVIFSEIAARPAGVGQWDRYSHANDIDLYKEWADGLVYGETYGTMSRQYCSAILNLRPTQDGHIDHYEGVEGVFERYGVWITASHFPEPGTPTQPVAAGYRANAWLELKFPNYDDLRHILTDISHRITVVAS